MSTSDHNFIDLAAFNKAVGDVLRLEVLKVLAQDAYGVLELSQIFDSRQSGMSHHLKVLAEAGLVAKRREGNSIFYSRALPLADQMLMPLQQQLYAVVDQLELASSTVLRVAQVKHERAAQSQAFFEQNAQKFKQQQDLIAEYPIYGEAVTHMLTQVVAGVEKHTSARTALEIGPGEGEFLPVLAVHFNDVLALDNAPAMLEHAREYCQQQELNNIQFVCDDTSYLRTLDDVDCAVMNMVLHHTSSPADIFHHIAGCLADNGSLIVTELCRHDQDWAKAACGDLWLGFDTDELERWALLAGLQKGHSNYLALRNGFQIQLQQFIKR